MEGDEQDGNVGSLDADSEDKPADLAKGRVRRDTTSNKAHDSEYDQDQGLCEIALDQEQDQPANG
jgi:hypothetical protein